MVPSYLQLGRYDEAIDSINHWPEHEGALWPWAWKAAVYGRAGRQEEARRALAKLEQVPATRTGLPAMLLVAYSGMGQKDRVLELLERAYFERSNLVMQIKVDPLYDSMRSDPRFEDLLRHVGLQR